MTIPRCARFCVVLAGIMRASHADTVFLNNADRLSGEIQKLEGKHLHLKTAYAGVIEIDWTMVRGITSEHVLEFSMENGMIFKGAVENVDEGMRLSAGSALGTILPHEVKSISRPAEEEALISRLEGAIDVGYSLTRGNSRDSQSSVAANAEYRAEHFRVQTELSSLFSKQASSQSTSSHSISSRIDFYLTHGAFLFALAGFDRDDRELLNLRSTTGGGLGRQLAHTRAMEVSVLGGLTYVHEDYRKGDGDNAARYQSTGEALAGLALDRLQLGRIRFTGKASVYPNVLDGGRVRVVTNAGVRLPVLRNLTWNLRLFERFDSRPVRSVRKNDYGLTSGFGFVF